jgi:hypothetical protein
MLNECNPPGHKDVTHRILNHLILVNRYPPIIQIPIHKASNRLPQQEVEDDEESNDEKDSIHSGPSAEGPQSYGTGGDLSRERITLLPT